MAFETQTIVDLAIPIIKRGFNGENVLSFDAHDYMTKQDCVEWGPEKPERGEWKGYYRWWVCWTFHGTGYVRRNLVWGAGEGKPGEFLSSSCFVDPRLSWRLG